MHTSLMKTIDICVIVHLWNANSFEDTMDLHESDIKKNIMADIKREYCVQ